MSDYRDELNKLFTLGRPTNFDVMAKHLPNMSFTKDDIPALLEIVLENSTENFEESKSWAAVHAWRILGQLKANQSPKEEEIS
jgi:hypothetical protein